MLYNLMNKDLVVGSFDISGFDTDNIVLNSYDGFYTPRTPYGFSAWLKSRYKFSCAKDVSFFFNTIGVSSLYDFIEVFHCISLRDTFWVKRSDDDKCWRDVSPYSNSYSKVVSSYALDGILSNGKNYLSPDVSTGGSYPHTWKWYDGNIYFIKASSKFTLGGSNSGKEPYSEYFTYKIGEYLGFNMLKYDLREHRRKDTRIDLITSSLCYNTEDVGSVSVAELGLNSYKDVIEFCKKLSKSDVNTILDMYFLDCICLNTDRHFSNIEFSVDNNNGTVLGIRPIFDNNNALLSRFLEGYDKFVRSDYLTRTDESFDSLFKLVSNYKNYKNELIKLKRFKLSKPKVGDITLRRVRFLNKLLQSNVKYYLQL